MEPHDSPDRGVAGLELGNTVDGDAVARFQAREDFDEAIVADAGRDEAT